MISFLIGLVIGVIAILALAWISSAIDEKKGRKLEAKRVAERKLQYLENLVHKDLGSIRQKFYEIELIVAENRTEMQKFIETSFKTLKEDLKASVFHSPVFGQIKNI